MPDALRRYYGHAHLHFITFSCYQRLPGLGQAASRDCFLAELESVRSRYVFAVVGYVVMPEHAHLLLSEPEKSNLSIAMQVLKQAVSRELHGLGDKTGQVWQRRWYDFNVFTERKSERGLRS